MIVKRLAVIAGLAALCAAPSWATSFAFQGSSGNLAASVLFEQNGADLTVVLSNTSTNQVVDPAGILTAVFFDLAGSPQLTRVSALLFDGSRVLYPSIECAALWGPDCGKGPDVGGEWAHTIVSGVPGGATEGISSAGLGLFGSGDLFPGHNLQGPDSPDGVQYGIVPEVGIAPNANLPLLGSNALISNSVIFTLTGLNTALEVSNVWFQYGTALTEPSFPSDVPEPSTLYLVAGAGLLLLGLRRRRFRR